MKKLTIITLILGLFLLSGLAQASPSRNQQGRHNNNYNHGYSQRQHYSTHGHYGPFAPPLRWYPAAPVYAYPVYVAPVIYPGYGRRIGYYGNHSVYVSYQDPNISVNIGW